VDKFQNLLERLQELKLKQSSTWIDDIPDDIQDEYFSDGYETLASDLNPDKRRWYETSTEVISVCGGLLGITQVSRVYSETMGFSDVEHEYKFFPMREVTVVSYEPA